MTDSILEYEKTKTVKMCLLSASKKCLQKNIVYWSKVEFEGSQAFRGYVVATKMCSNPLVFLNKFFKAPREQEIKRFGQLLLRAERERFPPILDIMGYFENSYTKKIRRS